MGASKAKRPNPDDLHRGILKGLCAGMHAICSYVAKDDFEAEADALMSKLVKERGHADLSDIMGALMEWQEMAFAKDTAFPLTGN